MMLDIFVWSNPFGPKFFLLTWSHYYLRFQENVVEEKREKIESGSERGQHVWTHNLSWKQQNDKS